MGKAESVNTEPGTSTLDLALRIVEHLAYQSGPTPLGAIAAQLRQPGKGIVTLIVPGSGGQEIEIKLPKQLQITPAHRHAIKSLAGVSAVEAV
ncbi:MAG: hypothetical protein J0H30_04440 [Alphaproteobacteria bacterium]|nr:hypothetical protein [Alphaproteobacteria bacterium]